MYAKWLFDRTLSALGLLVAAPVMLVVAVLIRITMPNGPVFFRQERVGLKGRIFTIYKFRTMTVGHGGPMISVAGESRITPLGAKLRRYKLDELPQLWNVLKGDMSFVGPRPDVPSEIDKLTDEQKALLLSIRPGITGPASLKYAHEERILQAQEEPLQYYDEVVFPDKVRINLDYVAHRSFWKDIAFMVKTII
jgi:hypothetical protein